MNTGTQKHRHTPVLSTKKLWEVVYLEWLLTHIYWILQAIKFLTLKFFFINSMKVQHNNRNHMNKKDSVRSQYLSLPSPTCFWTKLISLWKGCFVHTCFSQNHRIISVFLFSHQFWGGWGLQNTGSSQPNNFLIQLNRLCPLCTS